MVRKMPMRIDPLAYGICGEYMSRRFEHIFLRNDSELIEDWVEHLASMANALCILILFVEDP
jgi:hypothetical protein